MPVLAMGCHAKQFDGFYDNTDVAKKIARAMGVSLDNQTGSKGHIPGR